jgi:hypothetical protein
MMAMPGLATQASAAAAAAYQAFDRAALIDVQGSRFLLMIEHVLAALALSPEFHAACVLLCTSMTRFIIGCRSFLLEG